MRANIQKTLFIYILQDYFVDLQNLCAGDRTTQPPAHTLLGNDHITIRVTGALTLTPPTVALIVPATGCKRPDAADSRLNTWNVAIFAPAGMVTVAGN